MAVSKKAKSLYNRIFDGTETKVANAIIIFQERRALRKCVKHMPPLSSAQKKAVKEYWKPYCRVSTNWCRYYTFITGKFDPAYIPNDLYYTKIDQHFNNRKLGYGFNDKNYYSLIFPGITQPKTLVRKIGGLLFDADYHLIDVDQAISICQTESEVIVKPSQDSGSGRNIAFYHTTENVNDLTSALLSDNEKNLVVQQIVKQHYELAKMHPQSLNTIRIYTLMLSDGVHVLSASLKMGANESRIDNVSANSGVIVGILDNGKLMDFAFSDMYSGKKIYHHPQGMLFSDIQVPFFDKMIETVKRAAQYTGNFKMVGWDMSVDEDGNIVLIEANMRKGGMGPIQCEFGPFFASLTKEVLDEVFGVQNQ